ncbi:MAG: DNA polymerase III subunit beta [Dissulfurimicrobium sp.]|uniref:DNA polymerase III subunit beta n=1 Tax=Dissulfurimicrobium TaxID=1769732 RepID=UPI001EDBE86C|nr:DNA polymerase III subunit beta [Dissulfurimicrobium hydrothermale]UKL14066.1 DNA polymerase III subunit beta [Dissulfurimicrobium hydrothermale]
MLKLIVKKNNLLNPLYNTQSIVDKKTTMNIINNVLIYSKNNELFIEATDLELSYKNKILCSVIEEGSITVNAKKFYEIVKEFPDEEINIEELPNLWLKISSLDKIEYKIAGLPAEDFPKFKYINTENSITIETSLLKEMIEKTIFSTSLDDKKINLSGIYLEQFKQNNKNILRMVSSDGHRLSLIDKYIDDDVDLNIESGIIIPRKGAQEIKKITENHNTISLGIDEKFCFVKADNEYLAIRLIDAKFPNYKSIIPQQNINTIIIDKDYFFNVLKRVIILSSDSEFNAVKFSVYNSKMKIESIVKEIGEVYEFLDIEYNNEPFEIALNAKFLMTLLMVMKSKKIKLIINTPESPCIIKGDDDEGFLSLIMPMSIV